MVTLTFRRCIYLRSTNRYYMKKLVKSKSLLKEFTSSYGIQCYLDDDAPIFLVLLFRVHPRRSGRPRTARSPCRTARRRAGACRSRARARRPQATRRRGTRWPRRSPSTRSYTATTWTPSTLPRESLW